MRWCDSGTVQEAAVDGPPGSATALVDELITWRGGVSLYYRAHLLRAEGFGYRNARSMTHEPTHFEPGLVTIVDGQPHLIGGRCGECGVTTFPIQASCSRCGGEMSPIALPNHGAVWAHTVQHIEPKEPYVADGEWKPFALAYVDLGPVKVETRLTGKPIDDWNIGDEVALAPGEPDPTGAIWRYRFVPATSDSPTSKSQPDASEVTS